MSRLPLINLPKCDAPVDSYERRLNIKLNEILSSIRQELQMIPIYGKTTESTFQVPSIDIVTHDLVTIDEVHNEIHNGDVYYYADAVTLNNATSQDYLITTPNTAKWAHFTFSAGGSQITTVRFFEATDKTGTTLQTVFNANRNSANTAALTVRKGTSGGTTDGAQLFVFSSGIKEISPASLQHNNEWILKQNTKYILRLTSGADGNLCNIDISWYEHTSLTA